MDQHPIPQDVTGFQFKLIGSMTVKQFGYVAAGVISAVILYYLPLSGFFGIIFKIIFIPLLGGSGVVIAFIPIEGRPVDIMATNFFKALFSPNQYVYRKQGRILSFTHIAASAPKAAKQIKKTEARAAEKKEHPVDTKSQQLQAYLMHEGSQTHTEADKKEMAFLKSFSDIATKTAPAAAPVGTTHHVSTTTGLKKTVTVAHPSIAAPKPQVALPTVKPAQPAKLAASPPAVQAAPKAAPAKPAVAPAPSPMHEQAKLLEDQVKAIHEQKAQLEQELLKLKSQLSTQKTGVPATETAPAAQTPPAVAAPQPMAPAHVAKPAAPAATTSSQYVKIIPPTEKKKINMPSVSDTPNVVVGIVKDPRGNVLPNILVEIKDKEGNPVRAFKTNPLGQFASATPLANGIYTIELEDPKKQQQFDVIQLAANGLVLMPIEIVSHDAREQLRKELFN